MVAWCRWVGRSIPSPEIQSANGGGEDDQTDNHDRRIGLDLREYIGAICRSGFLRPGHRERIDYAHQPFSDDQAGVHHHAPTFGECPAFLLPRPTIADPS